MAEERARKAAKGWVTRAATKLETLLAREDVGSDEWRLEAVIVESEFLKRLEALDAAQLVVEETLPDDKLMDDIDKSSLFRDSFTGLRARFRKGLTVDPESAPSSATHSAQMQLPKLALPTFDGDVRSWPMFWESFCACVDQADLPEVSKLSYLRSLVKGEALTAISGLSLTGASYKAACDILCQRFGRPEKLIFMHIEALLNVKQCDLQHLQDELLSHVRSLEGLGVEGEKFGVFLTPLVLSKLPEDVRLEWARGAEGKESDLSFLLEFLASEIARRERSGNYTQLDKSASAAGDTRRCSTSQEDHHTPPSGRPGRSARWDNRPGPATGGGTRRRERPAAATALQMMTEACGFCSGKHPSVKCSEWVGLNCRDRFSRVRVARLCFCCLGADHTARSCNVKCGYCKGKHHTMCCFQKEGADAKPVTASQSGGPGLKPGVTGRGSLEGVTLSSQSGGERVVLPTATVQVLGSDGRSVCARILFDSGADRTFVSERLVNRVKGKWKGSLEMTYAAFGGGKGDGVFDMFELQLTASNASLPAVHNMEAVRVPIICTPLQRPRIPAQQLATFSHLPLADTYLSGDAQPIDILVGQDQYWSLVGSGLYRSPEGLVAQETVFGWVLCGRADMGPGTPLTGGVSCQLLTLTGLPVGRKLWSGDDDDAGSPESVLKEFEENVTFQEGRYEVKLPWKSDGSVSLLMSNKEAALGRLASLSRRLDKEPVLRDRYDAVLEEMEMSGVIVEVPTEELASDHPTSYLPHRPVLKQSGSLKVRPVFDASAKGPNGISLNDCVEVGPALTPHLLDILIRFRRWRYGFSADIVKAFLQIGLAREDQDAHRFLWRHGARTRVMRFQRVTFGVACSPFLLNATIQHHLAQSDDSHEVSEMRDNFYCDDLLSGADSEEEVADMLQEACSVMREAGMELSKCTSNSPVLFCEQAASDEGNVKVLGVSWCPDRDTLNFVGQQLPVDTVPTKRVVLSVIARMFDPLGFLTPFVMLAKCLFQELWEKQLGWDEPLPESCADVFSRWMGDCGLLQRLEVPRCYSDGGRGRWTEASKELHVFADASPKAYGAVVYLRLTYPDGSVTVSFVMSKARVAPLKRQTLPRLELLGCLLAAQLFNVVRNALQLPSDVNCTFWTDSMIALGWVRGRPQRWKQYVSNRVSEIQRLTLVDRWSHCSGTDNPADLVTRGVLADVLLTSPLWLSGPAWLARDDPVWRDATAGCDVWSGAADAVICERTDAVSGIALVAPSDADDRTFTAQPAAGAGSPAGADDADPVASADETAVLSAQSAVSGNDLVLTLQRYDSLGKATRVMAYVLRFIHRARRMEQSGEQTLTDAELKSARRALYRAAQADSFPAEVAALRLGKEIPVASPLRRLSPFLADGLLRVRGRLQFSDLSYEEKHPVIVPRGHLAHLIVSEQHLLMHHAGVATLMTAVRSEFWVVGLRVMARRVVRGCLACRRLDAPACSEQTAPLPRDRATRAPPFGVTGIDFAGPLFSVDFPRKKLYICLFTCAVTRAVHLEMTESLSLEHFVMAFRRFTARRGVPSTVYSDNARTFVGADVLLRKYFGRLAPHWKFIAPVSPWWGGWWERLVRSVKTALRKTLGKRCLTRTELETVLCEVEACVNSRPLTFQGDSPDCPNPLTPNHFLTGHSVGFQAKVAEDPSSVTASVLSDRARIREMRMTKFWAAWTDEYLRNLPPAVRGSRQGELNVGTPVLIHEEKTPRLRWNMGVVTRLFRGRDGLVRSAEVRTGGGYRTRAVQRLHSLEIPPSCPLPERPT